MNKDNVNFPVFPEKSSTESILETVKTVTDIGGSFFPGIGPAISDILGRKIEKYRSEKLNSYLMSIADKVSKLPQEVVDLPEFNEALYTAINHYMTEPSEKKRIFITHLNNSLFKLLNDKKNNSDSTFDIFFIFNDLFDQLSLPALDCLIKFKDKFGMLSTRYEIVDFFRQLHPIHGKRAFSELVNNSLLEDEESQENPPTFNLNNNARMISEVPIGQKKYKLQPLGSLFVDWLLNQIGDNIE